jgi:UDPglucose 6-dehydrogenase
MRISVIGTGYVGLVTGTCLAENGNQVTCIDIDSAKIDMLKAGKCPIYEPDLELYLERNIKHQRLSFTTDLAAGLRDSVVVFLALPTPPNGDGAADLTYVLNTAEQLSQLDMSFSVVVNKSTVPVGTAERVQAIFDRNNKQHISVVSNPEFLREGCAVDDFMRPERIIIGSQNNEASNLMGKLYEPFVRQGNPIYYMDTRSAELTKYAANAYLATRITFMNELANLCERLDANVDKVRIGMGSDSRIGKRFLFPGIGYGGSCFPKDVLALHKTGLENSYNFSILESVINVNDHQRTLLVEKIIGFFGDNLSGLTFGIWGLSFKPNTDDIREAPSLYIINKLLALGAKLKVYDPEAMTHIEKQYGQSLTYGNSEYEVLEDADALLILTEWSIFRSPDFEKMRALMKQNVIFDGRNVFQLEDMARLNFYYNSIGRKTIQ